MFSLAFSGRRIKSPERGLLSMHPFVDVLEGRSLFTATAHAGAMEVTAVVDVRQTDDTGNPWSAEYIAPTGEASNESDPFDAGTAAGLVAATTPGRIDLEVGTTGSAFAVAGPIGDTDQTLFGNALWDRRGRGESARLPTDAELAAARETLGSTGVAGTSFRDGRSLTGAMRPYLTMSADQTNHPFAA